MFKKFLVIAVSSSSLFCAYSAQVLIRPQQAVIDGSHTVSQYIPGGEFKYQATYPGGYSTWRNERNRYLSAKDLRCHLMAVLYNCNAKTRADLTQAGTLSLEYFYNRHQLIGRVTQLSKCLCLQELVRMLLAEIPPYQGNNNMIVNHNNAHNRYYGEQDGLPYALQQNTLVPNNGVNSNNGINAHDMHKICRMPGGLLSHILDHGHLGYFPVYYGSDPNGAINKSTVRGIFNINQDVMRRVNQSQIDSYAQFIQFIFRNADGVLQRNILTKDPGSLHVDDMHLLPNKFKVGYRIDPWETENKHPNLQDTICELVVRLLTAENEIENITIGDVVDAKKFTIDVTYNYQHGINGVTGRDGLGFDLKGNITNKVRIVVEVVKGQVNIVTMYPI